MEGNRGIAGIGSGLYIHTIDLAGRFSGIGGSHPNNQVLAAAGGRVGGGHEPAMAGVGEGPASGSVSRSG